jgi:hypothetical protein
MNGEGKVVMESIIETKANALFERPFGRSGDSAFTDEAVCGMHVDRSPERMPRTSVHYSVAEDAPWLWYEPFDLGRVPARGGPRNRYVSGAPGVARHHRALVRDHVDQAEEGARAHLSWDN